MSKRRTETATFHGPVPTSISFSAKDAGKTFTYERTDLHGFSPAAERARQLRIIELLESIAATVGQGKTPESK